MATRARQRDHVLATIEAASEPVDASYVAEALDVHVSTARFHLNKLIDDGLIQAVALPATTVGRPRTGYSSTVAKPEIRLIGLLVETLGDDEAARAAAAVEIGRRWAAPIIEEQSSDLPDPVTVVEAVLTKLGFQVQSAASVFGQHELSICSCPLRDITRADPAVSRGIVEGALRQALSASPALDGQYDVSVAPDPAGTDCTIALRLTPAR
ncbi:transcriptional regulator [Gordonia sp. (in: high G+C Gram-positive bacteria)]|uniref:transcriptional regulator n=1 Tax=Gordonia sp. (in: high G+C Gram-positive bacteria) TaxID=84139 RepID=UPI0039E46FF1